MSLTEADLAFRHSETSQQQRRQPSPSPFDALPRTRNACTLATLHTEEEEEDMQYVRSISGSVSKTWNSINPATLSGAIDVIVVEGEDGSLACRSFSWTYNVSACVRH